MALALSLVSMVALLTFIALAVDLGTLAIARTQCQDAADSAAMAGTRTLNGVTASNNNYSAVGPAAVAAATANTVLSSAVNSSQVSVNIGRDTYNTSTQTFQGQFPGPSTANWSMVQATITANVSSQLAFSRIFNFSGANIVTNATAVHRPCDIAVVLDYSGSMRFASLLGDPYDGNRTSNNPDTVVPAFGHYSNVPSQALTATSFPSPYDPANVTTTTSDGCPPIVNDFYTNSSGTPAFTGTVQLRVDAAGRQLSEDKSEHRSVVLRNGQDLTGSTSYNATWDSAGAAPEATQNTKRGLAIRRGWLLGEDFLSLATGSESGQGLAPAVPQFCGRRRES